METDLVKLMQALIDVAEGRAPADLVFVNASIVDVYRLRVARGQVAVKFGCIAGVLFEAFMRERQPHWLTAAIYVAMGWLVVFRLPQLVAALDPTALVLLAAGGVCYTVGAVFYVLKKIRYMHSIFHLWVLAGSVLQFLAVVLFVI